ncbi:MAG: decaprenyl-phosphate phosphoribosyltransferase [Myxococcota bacterium]|nr:decaprenyl-phosphate phosphoribosyltransferase [Myxococcota bacterium]
MTSNTPNASPVRKRSVPLAMIRAMRPKQWTKNGLLFAALVFSLNYDNKELFLRALAGFGCFCLISSVGYIYNDIRDREADALHPKKKKRPIAAGELPVATAVVQLILMAVAGFAGAYLLSPAFAIVAAGYFATTLSYSLFFKDHIIIDVMMIAAGFLWRAAAGAVVIDVHLSEWLLLCTGFLALFLGFNKRRGELSLLQSDASEFRKNLGVYTPELLDEFQGLTTSGTVISYALYTVLASPTPWLLLTLPHVLYGIFRYIFLVQVMNEGGSPDETLYKDRPILLTTVTYVITVIAVLAWAPLKT